MNLKKRLNEKDLERIKAAVKNAEEKISGEIVPVLVERSGDYFIALYKGSLIGAAFTFVTMVVLDRFVINDAVNTLFYDPVFILLMVVLGGVVGAVVPYFSDPVKRLLVARQYQDLVTRQCAENAFLEEEVFKTRQRTGVMIFVSFFEHEVIVMADKGISKIVDQKQWDKIVQDIIQEIRNGRLVEALENGIKQCGDILLEKGFRKTIDDVNELGDDLRV
jgi:putative membrane protein